MPRRHMEPIMNKQPSLAPLVSHPFPGPWLEHFGDGARMETLSRYASQLERELGASHPHTQIARSWGAVAYGAELFDDKQLAILKEAEPAIREHFPDAHWALAMNLAAQGCHTWFLHSHEEAIPMFAEAHEIMFAHQVGCDADVVKVAEVLADCLAHCDRVDEAVQTLHRVATHVLGAVGQSAMIVEMYEELREELIEEYGADVRSDMDWMVDALAWPRMNLPRSRGVAGDE